MVILCLLSHDILSAVCAKTGAPRQRTHLTEKNWELHLWTTSRAQFRSPPGTRKKLWMTSWAGLWLIMSYELTLNKTLVFFSQIPVNGVGFLFLRASIEELVRMRRLRLLSLWAIWESGKWLRWWGMTSQVGVHTKCSLQVLPVLRIRYV